MVSNTLFVSIHSYFECDSLAIKIEKHKINSTDVFIISYRYHDNIVIVNGFGHNDGVVKIGYCYSPSVYSQTSSRCDGSSKISSFCQILQQDLRWCIVNALQ